MFFDILQDHKLNVYFIQSLMYLLIMGIYFLNTQAGLKPKLINYFLLLMLAGFPPSPVFFTKIWLGSVLFKKIPITTIVLLLLINSATVHSYSNFIFFLKNKKQTKGFATCDLGYSLVRFSYLILLFLAAPNTFMVC